MTGDYVVDSCVVIRWYVDQVGHEHAREIQADLAAGKVRLRAPDILRWEVVNVLRSKGVDLGVMSEQDLVNVVDDLDLLGVELLPTSLPDLKIVTRLSAQHRFSLFDAAFVAMALNTGATLLTSDLRLVRAVGNLVPTQLLRGVGP